MVLRVHIPFGPSSNFGQYLIDSKCPIGKMIHQLNTNKNKNRLHRELPNWALYDQWLLVVITREVFCDTLINGNLPSNQYRRLIFGVLKTEKFVRTIDNSRTLT